VKDDDAGGAAPRGPHLPRETRDGEVVDNGIKVLRCAAVRNTLLW